MIWTLCSNLIFFNKISLLFSQKKKKKSLQTDIIMNVIGEFQPPHNWILNFLFLIGDMRICITNIVKLVLPIVAIFGKNIFWIFLKKLGGMITIGWYMWKTSTLPKPKSNGYSLCLLFLNQTLYILASFFSKK